MTTPKLSISQSTLMIPNKKFWLETEQDSTPTPTSRLHHEQTDFPQPQSALKLSIDLSSVNNPSENTRMVLVKNKLLKLSNDFKKQVSSPSTQSTRYTFQQTPQQFDYSFDTTPKSARCDGTSTANNGFSLFRKKNAHSQISNLNLKKVDSFFKAIMGEHTRQESEDYKLKKKRPLLSKEAEKFKQIIGDCDNLNKEVNQFEKQVHNTGTEYNKKVAKLQQPKQEPTKTKDFWRTDANFLTQRAKMRAEIDNFKNQVREKEENAMKKKMEAQLNTEMTSDAKSDVSDEEPAMIGDNVSRMLLKTPKTRESRKFASFLHKSKFSTHSQERKPEGNQTDKPPQDTQNQPQPQLQQSAFQNFFDVIGGQDKEESKKTKKKKLILKKLDKIGQLNKIDFDYDMKTETPMRVIKTSRSKQSTERLSFTHKFDYLQDSTDNVANADIKRRQQAFLAQFKKEKHKSHIRDDFSAFKSSSYTQRLHSNNK